VTLILGAALGATQFPILTHADHAVGLWAWVLVASVAESLYWPIYHSAAALLGDEASRGREIGARTAVTALVGVIGPLVGGFLLAGFDPLVDFALASVLALSSVVPLALIDKIPAGAVPTARQSVAAIDTRGMGTFAADGWMASGLAIAWPMILFTSLGSHYEVFGWSNAAAGLVGAVTGVLCGRAVDRGNRDTYVALVTAALLIGFGLRAGASWSPLAAAIANATGAAVTGLYVPVLLSVIYERAKRSGSAYRFHFSAEAGWDTGAAVGCLSAAVVAWFAPAASLAVLPAALGVLVLWRCLRGQPHPAAAPGRKILASSLGPGSADTMAPQPVSTTPARGRTQAR
jgi:hypothetical protein